MPPRVHFEVADVLHRRARVLAAEADTSLSGAMRALVELWASDEALQRRVAERADPIRRSTRVGSDS